MKTETLHTIPKEQFIYSRIDKLTKQSPTLDKELTAKAIAKRKRKALTKQKQMLNFKTQD